MGWDWYKQAACAARLRAAVKKAAITLPFLLLGKSWTEVGLPAAFAFDVGVALQTLLRAP
jgi:hypothetical protein